jgi:hypothetical protein
VRLFADYADVEPPHAELAMALAAEFRPVDAHAVERALQRLAERLAARAPRHPLEALQWVGVLVRGEIAAPRYRLLDDADFMLDAVLASGHGQPVMQAVVAVETGRRNGVPLGIVSDGRRHFVAHRALREALLLDFGSVRGLRSAAQLRRNLDWHCAHQVGCSVLQNLSCRALESGDLSRAIRAAELKLELPFDHQTRELASSDLRDLRARLN